MKKVRIFLVALVLAFSINQTTASAALSNYQMFATSSGFATYLNSITRLEDSVRLNFGPGKVYYYTLGIYAQSSYNSNDHTYQTGYIGSSSGLINARLKCDAYWNVRIYDASKNKKATVKLVTYNTGNGPCKIDELDKEHPNTLPPPSTENPNPVDPESSTDKDEAVPEGEGSSCADITCQCIENVGEALLEGMDKNGQEIVDAIEQGDKNIVTAINKNTAAVVDGTEKIVSAVNKVTKAVNDLHDEFKTDKTYKVKDIPDTDKLIVKPNQPTEKFEDKTQYFKDEGDSADTLGPMPDIIPVEDWDGLTKEDDQEKENELSKDNEMTKDNMSQDAEMTKDNMSQDAEMTKDKMSQDAEMTKDKMSQDAEMTKDKMSQDAEMTKDNMSQDAEMTKDNMSNTEQYNQTHIYQKAPSMTQKDLE